MPPPETQIPLLDQDVALVGTSEKGFLNVDLVVKLDPKKAGHSSRPPRSGRVGGKAVFLFLLLLPLRRDANAERRAFFSHGCASSGQAINILARALTRIEDNPLPGATRLPLWRRTSFAFVSLLAHTSTFLSPAFRRRGGHDGAHQPVFPVLRAHLLQQRLALSAAARGVGTQGGWGGSIFLSCQQRNVYKKRELANLETISHCTHNFLHRGPPLSHASGCCPWTTASIRCCARPLQQYACCPCPCAAEGLDACPDACHAYTHSGATQTIIRGGMKVNMLPTTANCTINVRCAGAENQQLRAFKSRSAPRPTPPHPPLANVAQ